MSIDQHLHVKVQITGQSLPVISSSLSGVQNTFENLDVETSTTKDVYRVGDRVRIVATEADVKWCDERGVDMPKEYGQEYRVSDISVEYFEEHPNMSNAEPHHVELIIWLEKL